MNDKCNRGEVSIGSVMQDCSNSSALALSHSFNVAMSTYIPDKRLTHTLNYHQTPSISPLNSKTWMYLVSSYSWLCPIHWSKALSREWRCIWSIANRRCSNYIWVINNIIAYQSVAYIRGLMVFVEVIDNKNNRKDQSSNMCHFSLHTIECRG